MANVVRTLPVLTIGTAPVQISTDKTHKWHSVSLQSDFSNTSGVLIYIGDNNVSPTRYSRALRPGDYFVSEGSAVDPQFFWAVATAPAQLLAVSGN